MQAYLDHLVPPAPGLRVQPAEMALVNYPVLFDARGLAPVTATFAALGVPVTLHATPVGYDWTIDGVANALRTTSPGRPYDGHGATLGDGYYVSRTFDHHGPHTVAVTVHWSASFDVAGRSGVPVAGWVIRTSAPVSFTVHEAIPRLVAD